jgi:L-threonylcarbamoyladenylate synthase
MELVSNPTEDKIKNAARALKDGYLVAFPTETVYGLGADATNEIAVSRVYSVKVRPTNHPLIVHISSINQLDKWAIDIPEYALKLAKEFWPGPMTLILNRSNLAKNFVTGSQESVGIRVSDNMIAQALCNEFENIGGIGIAAPSANRFGAISPTSAGDVIEELENYLSEHDVIIDGGRSKIGIESTIIDCTGSKPLILRPGSITQARVDKTLELKSDTKKSINNLRVSGSFNSHYAPKAKVIYNRMANPGEGFLALMGTPTPEGAVRLASPVNIVDFAHKLYEALRLGDKLKLKTIVVEVPNDTGLASAILDRVKRAAGY